MEALFELQTIEIRLMLMMKFRQILPVLLVALLATILMSARKADRVVVAYVTSWTAVEPDPQAMTHINYAFGVVNDSCNGININNAQRLRQIAGLKSQNPQLKVLLSIGGWGAGGFSEMAADPQKRAAFAADCRRIVDKYGLDGVDIDWEYPTSSAAGISSSPDDTQNYTLLMRDIRSALGADRLLTLASVASAAFIDFPAIMPYVDFVNIMAYDMATAPLHHSPLYPSEHSGSLTTDKAVTLHLNAGIPAEKLVMGVPFYGRGGKAYPDFQDYSKVANHPDTLLDLWDDQAKVPYLATRDSVLVFGYENPRSIEIKCRYAIHRGLRGIMYWDYSADTPDGDLRKTVAKVVM